ncbi:MAG: 16S rRNA (uracil(1498)-N(3))-methyltransferase [Syntrophorhabdales bacterium]|jgi:16S rRNA (uracil1498-N3)-methyltransferase
MERGMETDLAVPASGLSSRRIGAIVTVRGPQGVEYRGRVKSIDDEIAVVRAFEELPHPAESPLSITLVQAIPKKEKMGFIVEKATELGVYRILPCLSASSAAAGDGGGQDKSHRWPDIARRAAAQCRRRLVPIVSPPSDFRQAIESFSVVAAQKLILYEKERLGRLKDIVAATKPPDAVIVVCGPEGGFADDEVAFAALTGFIPVSLGGRVLRCETAALAALSIIQYVWGDL